MTRGELVVPPHRGGHSSMLAQEGEPHAGDLLCALCPKAQYAGELFTDLSDLVGFLLPGGLA
eukprot:2168916-Amphidinium_carterae.1